MNIFSVAIYTVMWVNNAASILFNWGGGVVDCMPSIFNFKDLLAKRRTLCYHSGVLANFF